jgi:hypothetical protein
MLRVVHVPGVGSGQSICVPTKSNAGNRYVASGDEVERLGDRANEGRRTSKATKSEPAGAP